MSVLFEHHPRTANLVRHGTIPTVPGEHNHRQTGGGGKEEDSGRMTQKVGKRGMGWR
jgi:hypothetical protein